MRLLHGFLIAGLVCGILPAPDAQAQSRGRDDYFPLLIRGPFTIETSTRDGVSSIFISFRPAAAGAGETGVTLQPGSGAWVDRALRGTETPLVRWELVRRGPDRSVPYGIPNEVSTRIIMECASDPNRVLQVFARASGTDLLPFLVSFNSSVIAHPVR